VYISYGQGLSQGLSQGLCQGLSQGLCQGLCQGLLIPLCQYLCANTSKTRSKPIPLCHNQYKNISPINKMTFFGLLNDFILSMTMPGAKDGEEQ